VATLTDVARKAGVSIMTVSRVIRGQGPVREATRKRVLEAMAELQYAPRGLVAPASSPSSLHTLVLIVPDITNPFFTFLARGMEDVARKHGYQVLLVNTDEDENREREALRMCVDLHVDGVLICPVGDSSSERLAWLRQYTPLVLVDRGVQGIEADLVKGNVKEASRLLVSHLIEAGHRRIGIVTGPAQNEAARERLEGYRAALSEHGIPERPEYLVEASMLRDGDANYIDILLDLPNPPTGLFVANVFQYAHTRQRLAARHLTVPDDISIVAFGNTDELASVDSPLTAAIQPAYSYGSLGTQMLLERVEGLSHPPRRMILESHYVFRHSVAPPRS